MAFDSRQYEWADMTLILGGSDITGFRGIKYTAKIEREPVHAKGRDPHSIQSGNNTYEGEVVLLQSEYDALVDAGEGSVLSLNLDAEVHYGNSPDPIRTNRIMGLRFTEEARESKQGDKFEEITLPFICLSIKNNV